MPAVLSLLPLFSDSARLCPGSVPITLFSDSARLCARGSVPITTLFGLSAALCPRFCPYYHSFRTQRGSVPAVLSLLPLFSDSARLCARSSVPITTLFGLCAALCPQFCPYYHSFRTQRGSVPAVLSLLPPLFGLSTALCPQFCPYYHSFRTHNRSVPAVLSLLPLYSDSESLCARSSVPITTLFGLSAALCSAVLSESEPYLDSVELFSLKHCLNQTNLLNKRLFSWIFHSQVLFTFFKRDTNGHFGSIILAIRIGAVRRITFRVIFIILIVVDK